MGVRLQPPLLAALDKFIADEAKPITRPEAVRLLLTDSLIGLALLDAGADENGDGPKVRSMKPLKKTR